MNKFPVRCGVRRTMTSIAIHRLFLLIVTITAFTVSALAQDIQKLDPALEQLVGPDSKLERIATGFNKWTEGPVWYPLADFSSKPGKQGVDQFRCADLELRS